jgi:hypothetical protein
LKREEARQRLHRQRLHRQRLHRSKLGRGYTGQRLHRAEATQVHWKRFVLSGRVSRHRRHLRQGTLGSGVSKKVTNRVGHRPRRPEAGIGLYGPAVTQESLAAPSATGVAANPNGHQWTLQSPVEA